MEIEVTLEDDESPPCTPRNDTVAYTVENMPSSTKTINVVDIKKLRLSIKYSTLPHTNTL